MKILPMRLLRVPEAFDHPHWIFGPKMDGFRGLAHVEGDRCRLVSRNGHPFKSWPQLAEEIAHPLSRSPVSLAGSGEAAGVLRHIQRQAQATDRRCFQLLRPLLNLPADERIRGHPV